MPVFLADIKGDVSGVSAPGVSNDTVQERARHVHQEWTPAGCPTEFYALGGMGHGIPVRATVTSFGPVLLSKVLQLNRTQEQSLGLIFHYADQKGLELVDLKDLRAVVAFLTSDEGKQELKGIGGLSTATAGVILRSLTAFEAQGMSPFFGEPEFDTGELLRGRRQRPVRVPRPVRRHADRAGDHQVALRDGAAPAVGARSVPVRGGDRSIRVRGDRSIRVRGARSLPVKGKKRSPSVISRGRVP